MPTATRPRPTMARKGFAAPASAAPRTPVKVAPEGIVRAIVAVTGVVDSVNDLIVPGAFTASLAIRRPKVVDDHEWKNKAGRVLHVEELLPGDRRLPKRTKDGRPWPAAAGALIATMQYNLRSSTGAESYEWVRFYAETNEAEFSIGYSVPDGRARKRSDGVRVILQLNLFEFSHVLFGAAPLSMALEVKGMHAGSAGTTTQPGLGRAQKVGDEEPHEPPAPGLPDAKPWDEDEEKAKMETKTAAAYVREAKGLPPVEAKVMGHMKGSDEERRRLVERAVEDLLRGTFAPDVCGVCLVATYATEVIARSYSEKHGERTYLVPYTYDEATSSVELGEPAQVELSLVAEPVPGAAVAPQEPAGAPEAPDVDQVAVEAAFEPWAAVMALETKGGRAVRQHILALAASLQGKSAAPWSPEDEAAAMDAQGDPADPADPALVEEPAADLAKGADPGAALPEADEDTITADNLPDVVWSTYRKTEPIQAARMEGPFTVETREGVVTSSDGWLALDSDGWPYPIAAEEFEGVYELADEAPTDDPDEQAPADAPAVAPTPVASLEDAADAGEEETFTIDADEHFDTVDDLEAAA